MPAQTEAESYEMDEATLRAIFDEKLRDVAKKSDLLEVQNQLCNQDKRLQALQEKWQEIEKRVAAAESAPTPPTPRPGRTNTGSRASTTTATSSSGDPRAAWVPKLAHIKGFAAWGCGAEQKLRKQEVERVQQQIVALPGDGLRSRLEPMPRFTLNHNLSFKALGGPISEVAEDLDALLQRKCFKIRNNAVRATVEVHPWIRKRYAVWHSFARQFAARRREGVDYEPCSRSCSWLSLPNWVQPGKVRTDEDGNPYAEWNDTDMAQLGLCVIGDEIHELEDDSEFASRDQPPTATHDAAAAMPTASPSKGSSSAKHQRSGRGSGPKGKSGGTSSSSSSSPSASSSTQKRPAEQAVDELRDEDEKGEGDGKDDAPAEEMQE